MAQQSYFDKFKQPDARPVTTPAGSYFDKFKPEDTHTKPPEHSTWSKAMDVIQALLSSSALPGTRGMGKGLGVVRSEIANPENRSVMGGALGGIGGGALGGAIVGGPVGAIGGGILGAFTGGTAGSLTEGKSAGPAMKEGGWEALTQGVGSGGSKIVSLLAGAGARSAVRGALHPSRAVLDEMTDEAGQQFSTPGRARREFGNRAVANLDEFKGHPGGNRYAEGSIAKDEANRALKVDAFERTDAAGRTLTDDDLIPAGTFDDLVARMSQRSGTAAQDQAGIDNVVQRILSRSHVVPGSARNLPGARPVIGQSVIKDKPWGFVEGDQRVQGIQDELDKIFDANQKAQMIGAPVLNTAEDAAFKLARTKMSRGLANNALPATDGRSVGQLNSAMHRNFPVTRAAIDATMPSAGENMPRIRMAGSPTQPGNLQLFNYLGRGAAGLSARPLNATSKGLGSDVVGNAVSPQLLRVLAEIFRGQQ